MSPPDKTAADLWDPTQYLRFADERLRPAIDLLARVPLAAPKRVVDLGCGAGNVTALLAARFAGAAVAGVDGSAAMLERARKAAPGAHFVQADIAAWHPDAPVDLLFSNAALQWLGAHRTLLPHLIGQIAPGGVMAVQMPAMNAAPLRAVQLAVAARGPWAAALAEVRPAPPILDVAAYDEMLSPYFATLEIWETIYLHVLRGPDAVVEWASGTSLRPYLDRLDEGLRAGFRHAYAEALRPHYPARTDGTTLLPFRRMFLLGRKA